MGYKLIACKVTGSLLLFNLRVNKLILSPPWQPVNMQLLVKTGSFCITCSKASVKLSLVLFREMLKCNKPWE